MVELTLVYGKYNEMLMGVIMVYKPINITGGAHPVVPWSAGGIVHNHGYFPGIPQITYTNSSQKKWTIFLELWKFASQYWLVVWNILFFHNIWDHPSN